MNIIGHFYLVNDTAHFELANSYIMNRTDQRILTDSQTRKFLLIDFYRICYKNNNYLSFLKEYKAEVCAEVTGQGMDNEIELSGFMYYYSTKNFLNSGVSRLF